MPRGFDEIAADFDALTAHDFDYASAAPDGRERLDRLCDEVRAVNDVALHAPVLFRTMERLDGVDLGTPGPLVHTLESWPGGYERFLVESIHRKPSPLAVWMINRILNTKPADARGWLDLLRSVGDHSNASSETKESARHFMAHQAGG
jgi:hypothetical protein